MPPSYFKNRGASRLSSAVFSLFSRQDGGRPGEEGRGDEDPYAAAPSVIIVSESERVGSRVSVRSVDSFEVQLFDLCWLNLISQSLNWLCNMNPRRFVFHAIERFSLNISKANGRQAFRAAKGRCRL
jgi:hypothetical protein